MLVMIPVAIMCITACEFIHTHKSDGKQIVLKEATCYEEGEAQLLCVVCGQAVITVPIPKVNHTEIIIPG